MSKRKNDGEFNEKSKQQKPNDDADPNEIVVPVGFQDEMQPSAIFKLNAICCDDLFDWLSLEDLHSLGQTCKRMQRLTGIYFQDNFKGTLDCKYQSIYYDEDDIELDGFIKFVQKIYINNENEEEDFQYIGSNCDSLRTIRFDEVLLTKSMIDFIKGKLNNIESIDLLSLDFNSINLYEDFLIFCPNLKSLLIDLCEPNENEWMCHKYPKLTHLTLRNQMKNIGQNIETFSQQNPQLQSFGCDCNFLLRNSDTIINSTMKLDVLKIDCREFDDEFDEFGTLLNKLYENGFYKRLEIRCSYDCSQHDINLITKLPGLEKLIGIFHENNIVFPSTDSLKELYILCIDYLNTEEINFSAVVAAFPNLRIVYSGEREEINQFLPLIRQLPKLKELHIPYIRRDSNGIQIDLSKLNEERKKLFGACKLDIYVPENIYLETKMAPKYLYTNHDLIEIKRFKSGSMLIFVIINNLSF